MRATSVFFILFGMVSVTMFSAGRKHEQNTRKLVECEGPPVIFDCATKETTTSDGIPVCRIPDVRDPATIDAVEKYLRDQIAIQEDTIAILKDTNAMQKTCIDNIDMCAAVLAQAKQ